MSDAAELGNAPQLSNERGVNVTVIRQNIPNEAKILDFDVALETHTQDLSDDLAKSSVLIADGKQYIPLGWEGAPQGGHHRKGFVALQGDCSTAGVSGIANTSGGRHLSKKFQMAAEMSR
ncbi:MAG: hypothetical protein PHG89_06295 [Gallionella sp.]|nr:hypothetical protein [Gallionella sp.]